MANFFSKFFKKHIWIARKTAAEKAFFFIIPTPNGRIAWLRKKNKFALLGENVHWQPRKLPTACEQIKLHDNVAIATDVEFVTHDIMHMVFNRVAGKKEYISYRGCIEIHDNVFVGAHTIILPNVSIGPNTIIAAGTVVNKDLPGGGAGQVYLPTASVISIILCGAERNIRNLIRKRNGQKKIYGMNSMKIA